MTIPRTYEWLLSEPSPRILLEALKLYGVKEGAGPVNNQTILNWAAEVGDKVGIHYAQDSIPWCGLFIGVCAKRSGLDIPDICVRAKSWASWGMKITAPMLGDVLVFERPQGGHVGLYIGEDNDYYHVLGGNQSDQVNISLLSKNRLYAARRTKWKIKQPDNIRKVSLTHGGNVSANEA